MSASLPTSSACAASPATILQINEMLGVEIPLPALQQGWLHSRELALPWDAERIVERIGERCWFSHHCQLKSDAEVIELTEKELPKLRPYSLAGFWPTGGFIELRMRGSNPLDDHPRGTLTVYAASAAAAEVLLAELFAGYRQQASTPSREPRIGLLNYAYDTLSVERIRVTAQQIVPREHIDLYYRAGASAWIDAWIETLNTRRYGLTVLTGAPGTGKTTLLRSLAHWLVDTHVFYFMPAARFVSIESGEIVTFWADENRNSKLRKILILEDAESVLLRRGNDNREKVATLLNLTDGMLGDALGLHVVCTLNSDLTDLDPALLRPGRLVAHREFELFNADEARLLATHLRTPTPSGDRVSLAEFFNPTNAPALARPAAPRRAMGFHTVLPEMAAAATS